MDISELTHLEIGKAYQVELREQMYFNPWDGSREVPLVTTEERSRLSRSPSPQNKTLDDVAWFGENGILCATQSFVGKYVGDRPGIIKFEPAGGIHHPESEYLIVRQQDIAQLQLVRL